MMHRLVALLVFAAACASAPNATVNGTESDPDARGPDWIRVGLIQNVQIVELISEGAVELADISGRRIRRFETRTPFSFRQLEGGVELLAAGETFQSPGGFRIRPLARHSRIQAKGNVYAGNMRVARGAGGLQLVNILPMETYLRGVVPWEIGRPEPNALAAVKAQAVAARTYAYAHLGHWEQFGFDAYDSVSDQVYRGLTGVHSVTDRAIRETANIVASYDGQLIRAYYSSTCGGHGSTLEDVWTREPAPYLRGRRDGKHISWCVDSPHFRWSEAWSARELGEIIRANLPGELDAQLEPEDIGSLQDLQVLERDASGRVQRLRIVTDRASFDLWGDRIRWVLRPLSRFEILRSTLFEPELIRRDGRLVAVRLLGGGNGHGVGMCQTGALGMARGGYDHEEILRHYYSDVKLSHIGDLEVIP
jgi:stage II sporulation protein D